MTSDLLPCPMCGGTQERVAKSFEGDYLTIRHDDDCPIGAAGFYVTDGDPQRAERIAAWNRRPAMPKQPGEREALPELRKIATRLGEPNDPFAAWESLETVLDTLGFYANRELYFAMSAERAETLRGTTPIYKGVVGDFNASVSIDGWVLPIILGDRGDRARTVVAALAHPEIAPPAVAAEAEPPVGYISSDGFTVLIPDDQAERFKAAWDAAPQHGPLNKALPFYLGPIASPPVSRAGVVEDAERWRALMASLRLHFMGCAGFNITGSRSEEDKGAPLATAHATPPGGRHG